VFKCKIETLNGGVSGSDPFYSYYILRYKLLKYHPDLVVLTINKTDFDDFVCRGGDERFLSNGKIQTKSRPVIEWFFSKKSFAEGWL